MKINGGKWVNCAYCGAKKLSYPREWKIGRIKFCNIEHHILFQKQNSFKKNCVVCDKVFFCQPCQVRYRKRKTCSVACRGRYQRLLAIENRKKNGFTKHQLDRLARYSPEAEKWRKTIFERDNYTCQFCKVRGNKLEADHIKPFAYFPELRFELSNGRTLCRRCHDGTKISYKKMRELYLNVS